MLLDERNERQKELAIEAILVELARVDIRGRDHHHLVLEQRLEEPAEDHGVGNIRHMHLIEAQQG